MLEVNWYLDLIHSKIRRALYGYYIYSDKINATQEEDDYNGSAKVALLAVEISQNAWMVLRERLSSFEPNIGIGDRPLLAEGSLFQETRI